MTRLLLTLLIILSFSLLTNAQFSKGDGLLGGNLSYISNTTSGSSYDQINHGGNFIVALGKALNENSAFGINLSYSFSRSTYSLGPAVNNDKRYSIGVFYRKYKMLGKDFYLFGAASAAYNGSTSSAKDDSGNLYSSGNSNGGSIGFSPGIDYKISNKFLLEISMPNLFLVSYSSSKTTNQTINPQIAKGNQFGITTSLSAGPLSALGIGFILVL